MTDDDIVHAVQARIATGNYLDDISGSAGDLPSLTPASPAALFEAEAALGYPIPRLLRRLLIEVANGGFGPGYGILGVPDTVDAHRAFHAGRPSPLLPICDWGCGIASLVDCSSWDGAMWACDPNPGVEDDIFREPLTLPQWLGRWVDGRLNQPALIEDPATGAVRPATDTDFGQWEKDDAS